MLQFFPTDGAVSVITGSKQTLLRQRLSVLFSPSLSVPTTTQGTGLHISISVIAGRLVNSSLNRSGELLLPLFIVY